MANHALARRNRSRKRVPYRMPGFISRNRRIGRRAFAQMPVARVSGPNALASDRSHKPRGTRCTRCRDSRQADRSCPAAKAADPASRVFCSPRKTGSVRSSVPKPRSPNLSSGRAGLFLAGSDFRSRLFSRRRARKPAARSRAAKISHRSSGVRFGHHALGPSLFGRRRQAPCASSAATPSGRIAFAEPRILQGNGSVVVKRRAPQHAAVRHHAGADVSDFRRVAPGVPQVCARHAQISWDSQSARTRSFRAAMPCKDAPDWPSCPRANSASRGCRMRSLLCLFVHRRILRASRPEPRASSRHRGNPCSPDEPCASDAWSAHRPSRGNSRSPCSFDRLPPASA